METTDVRQIRRHVLIIEDNELNREILKEILQDNYDVMEAVDGLDGLEKLRENFRSLSLILLDVQMPRMNGYEFLDVYRQDQLLSSVPVIVTTSSTLSEDEERCLSLGASDFVTKPYNPKIIERRIEAIIRLRESIATLQAIEFDPRSGLYSRYAFQHHAGQFLEREAEKQFDMCMINVRDFAYINERWGEVQGDALLAHIGTVLSARMRNTSIACRYEGDHFLCMFEHRAEDIIKRMERIAADLHADAPISDFAVRFTVYENIPHDLPLRVIYDRMVLALESVQGNYEQWYSFYDVSMSERQNRLRLIEDCMEEALEEKQFKVYYQPKHDPLTGTITGAEALVRWIHPEYGFMSPGDFIPLFEENGFVTKLDFYVLRRVCEDLAAWRAAGIPLVPISVNASRRDLITAQSMDEVEAPLLDNGIEKNLVHIEITESSFIADERLFERIKVLHANGFRIELDDFGSGYSSLGVIADIPMDIIKLDMSFARAIEKQREVVRMIISLAHALGVKTVSEGVETNEQLQILTELGCDYIQGYYYSPPIPGDKFAQYLNDNVKN